MTEVSKTYGDPRFIEVVASVRTHAKKIGQKGYALHALCEITCTTKLIDTTESRQYLPFLIRPVSAARFTTEEPRKNASKIRQKISHAFAREVLREIKQVEIDLEAGNRLISDLTD